MKQWAIYLGLLAMACMGSPVAMAQQGSVPALPPQTSTPPPASTASNRSEYDPRTSAKLALSAGYTFRAFSPDASTTYKLNGGYISGEYTVLSRLGAVIEGTGAVTYLGSQASNNRQRLTIATGLGGARFYPFKHRKWTMFGEALFGAGFYNLYAPALGPFAAKTIGTTGVTYEFGGGADLRIKRHWAIRLVDADFLFSTFKASSIGNSSQTGYRISAGIVYLIGQK